MSEAVSLADAAGYHIERIISQKHITKSKFGVGSGKAQELKEIVIQCKPDILIFDEVLKPSQQYNLASLCKVEVIDRERLILEIFERRASTAESKVQIKLAQLHYDMIRAREKVRLAKAGEQPGFFGMGKYDADVYYLDIRKRAASLKTRLLKEETRREIHRIQRYRSGLATVSIAGYTSAGKTSLFNTLTGESKNVGQGLFTTLSTFTRAINLGENRVLVSDTVGFISKLPAYMIDAFKSTLNELTYSALVLLVLDISEPIKDMKRKLASSIVSLNELDVPMSKAIYILNKTDMIPSNEVFEKANQLGIINHNTQILPISANTGHNINQLKKLMERLLFVQNRKTSLSQSNCCYR
jgi:GTP-binding protein HflX